MHARAVRSLNHIYISCRIYRRDNLLRFFPFLKRKNCTFEYFCFHCNIIWNTFSWLWATIVPGQLSVPATCLCGYIRANRRHVAFTLLQRERFYIVRRSIWKDRVTALQSAASHEISRCATTLYANRTPSSRLLSCSLSSEVLNFIFGPLVAVPPVHRVARQVADIFSVILHPRPPRRADRSLLRGKKRKSERIDGAGNFIRRRQHFRATTIPWLSIIEMIFPRRKYRANEEYSMAPSNIAKIASRRKIMILEINYYWQVIIYIHVSVNSAK